MIKRRLNPPLNKSFFLFGPRQTGKSTLVKSVFNEKDSLYYNLLKSDEYMRLVSRPSVFREEVLTAPAGKKYVIVDEIQRIPEILNEIHYILESVSDPPVFCMTGSSARKLKRGGANLLAGRAWTFYLHPFTHAELGRSFSLEKALRTGTLPPAYLENDAESSGRTLKSYVDTYLKEEVGAEALVRNLDRFARFLPVAASENGNILNFSAIAQATGLTYKTVQEYFQILQDTLMGFFLTPFAGSPGRQVVKHPKFYFFDTGVQRAASGRLSVEPQRGTREYGFLFEHFVICEILRFISYGENDYSAHFYRTKSGAEVDLVIETPEKKIFAIEIKSSGSPENHGLNGLKSFSEIFPKAELYCVSTADKGRKIGKINIIPWQDIFAALKII
ncbi:MAG: ATPase [Elusimicrobia bacterium CG08_land_8_20_14_0_20_51_18]|nr:MAG: ATPase [Elusimicrobia bacterium CG08_land_8_20_14_0_20_51_18]